jgi:hypothetical protein
LTSLQLDSNETVALLKAAQSKGVELELLIWLHTKWGI